MRLTLLTCSALTSLALATGASAAPAFVNSITVAGDATDASGLPVGANGNRLSFGSDLYYDWATNTLYGLADRGPGGGVISFDTRIEQIGLSVNPTTGAISNFSVPNTVMLRDTTGTAFNGLNPQLLNGSAAVLGNSLDPEGLVVARNGNFYVSDEYGPSVKEFRPDGTLVRTFATPNTLLPRQADSTLNLVDGRPTITTGRQDNRGFEGLALSPDGSKLYAMLQDPLVNEGSSNDARRSANLRMVEFDTTTGQATRQFVYQLEALTDINARIPGTANDFSATSQGRNIGISAVTAINDHQFLVLERDNRGVGVGDVTGTNPPVASKRVYMIDIADATDVSNVSLAGTNTLPAGVRPVTKSLYLDIQKALQDAGQTIPEKIEGLTVGPKLDDGTYLLLLGTDNDFSVTQDAGNVQFNVCSNGTTAAQVAITDTCPAGTALLPSYLYAFKGELSGYVAPIRDVPEPASLGLLGVGLLGLGALRRRARG